VVVQGCRHEQREEKERDGDETGGEIPHVAAIE
jgi:hypothetical protein